MSRHACSRAVSWRPTKFEPPRVRKKREGVVGVGFDRPDTSRRTRQPRGRRDEPEDARRRRLVGSRDGRVRATARSVASARRFGRSRRLRSRDAVFVDRPRGHGAVRARRAIGRRARAQGLRARRVRGGRALRRGRGGSDAASAPASDASAASDGACTLVGYGVGERVRDGWYTMRDGEVRAYPRSWASRARTSASRARATPTSRTRAPSARCGTRARARTCAWRTRRARGGPSTPARRAAPCSRSRATAASPRSPRSPERTRSTPRRWSPATRTVAGLSWRPRNSRGATPSSERARTTAASPPPPPPPPRRRGSSSPRDSPRGGLRGRFRNLPRHALRAGSPRWGRARTRRW